MSSYNHAKYGITRRQWFGLTARNGGPNAGAGVTFNETQSAVVKRWYPDLRGPIDMSKAGVMTIATLGKGEESFRFTVDGTTSANAFATAVASTSSAPFTIASKSISKVLATGSYVSILASTNVCSTGTVALFIDWKPRFTPGTGLWNQGEDA